MRAYVDASALAKTLLSESGTATMTALFASGGTRCASRLSFVEVGHAICRHVREGRLDPTDADRHLEALATPDAWGTVVVEFDAEVGQRALQLLRRYVLRGADAVHLASALSCGAECFVSSDRRLLEAAGSEGLGVLDPTAAGWPPDPTDG